ncbi:MAG TPA: hypothetical protein VMF89_02930 [Polyangiales bacterium]|nr:hypothetical protein [Polyangiales bacterium]
MKVTTGTCLYTLATCLACFAINLEVAMAQQAPPPPTAAPVPPPAPAQQQAAQPQPAPPAYPPPPAAAGYPPPGAYAYPPPGAYAYPPPGYPPPPGAYAQPGGRYAPGPEYYRDERRERRPRRSRGMMIGGIALLAAGYVPPAIIGLGVGTQERSECDCRDALRLLIPIVGPLTLWKPNRDLNVFFNTLMVFDTLLQTTGLVLTIFGIMKYNASAQDAEYGKLPKPKLTFAATPTPGGAYAGLRLQL